MTEGMSIMFTSPTNRRNVLRLTGAAAGLAAMSRFNAVDAQEALSIALDWYPNANHAGLFLAEERGDFASAGLEIDPYTPSDPTTVLQTVGAGRDELGISYQTDVLLARAQGVPVVSVSALVQHPLVSVMTLEEAGIGSPADLAGMTIGYPGIPSQVAFLETMLETAGATIDEVELVNIGFNLVPALISGQVDAALGAYWTHETILAEQEGYPVDFMRVEEWGVPDYYELVIVTSEDMVANNPQTISTFLGQLQHGYLDAMADPESALDALEAAYPELDRAVEDEGIALLTSVWVAEAPYFGFQDPERWQEYADWMKSNGLIPADLNVDDAFTTALQPVPEGTPQTG